MKKYAAIFCLSLFVCGTVIVPALHQAELCCPHNECSAETPHDDHEHGEETPASDDRGDDDDNCAICKLAATPTIASCNAVQAIAPRPTTAPLLLTNTRTLSRLDSGSFNARAPPLLSSS